MATAKKAQELRRLMKQQKGASQKIVHPLAKYNNVGQITCQICNIALKNEMLWTPHLQSRRHKDTVLALKDQSVQPSKSKKNPATTQLEEPASKKLKESTDNQIHESFKTSSSHVIISSDEEHEAMEKLCHMKSGHSLTIDESKANASIPKEENGVIKDFHVDVGTFENSKETTAVKEDKNLTATKKPCHSSPRPNINIDSPSEMMNKPFVIRLYSPQRSNPKTPNSTDSNGHTNLKNRVSNDSSKNAESTNKRLTKSMQTELRKLSKTMETVLKNQSRIEQGQKLLHSMVSQLTTNQEKIMDSISSLKDTCTYKHRDKTTRYLALSKSPSVFVSNSKTFLGDSKHKNVTIVKSRSASHEFTRSKGTVNKVCNPSTKKAHSHGVNFDDKVRCNWSPTNENTSNGLVPMEVHADKTDVNQDINRTSSIVNRSEFGETLDDAGKRPVHTEDLVHEPDVNLSIVYVKQSNMNGFNGSAVVDTPGDSGNGLAPIEVPVIEQEINHIGSRTLFNTISVNGLTPGETPGGAGNELVTPELPVSEVDVNRASRNQTPANMVSVKGLVVCEAPGNAGKGPDNNNTKSKGPALGAVSCHDLVINETLGSESIANDIVGKVPVAAIEKSNTAAIDMDVGNTDNSQTNLRQGGCALPAKDKSSLVGVNESLSFNKVIKEEPMDFQPSDSLDETTNQIKTQHNTNRDFDSCKTNLHQTNAVPVNDKSNHIGINITNDIQVDSHKSLFSNSTIEEETVDFQSSDSINKKTTQTNTQNKANNNDFPETSAKHVGVEILMSSDGAKTIPSPSWFQKSLKSISLPPLNKNVQITSSAKSRPDVRYQYKSFGLPTVHKLLNNTKNKVLSEVPLNSGDDLLKPSSPLKPSGIQKNQTSTTSVELTDSMIDTVSEKLKNYLIAHEKFDVFEESFDVIFNQRTRDRCAVGLLKVFFTNDELKNTWNGRKNDDLNQKKLNENRLDMIRDISLIRFPLKNGESIHRSWAVMKSKILRYCNNRRWKTKRNSVPTTSST